MIPFIDLKAQQAKIRTEIMKRIETVLDHGAYIMGPEVRELEAALSEFCGAKHSVTCANGTDALTLALMAEEVGQDDVVFVPAFTFTATAEAPAQLGAVPFFVDVDEDSFNMSPASLEQAIVEAKESHKSLKAVIAVDLFGNPADYDAIRKICDENDLILIADAAQSFGGSYKGTKIGQLADYTTTSFFPAKPLGCYGDGGAVFTQPDDKADVLRSLRIHGKGTDKYDNMRIGLNSRLDTLQAAILLEKLAIFSEELNLRDQIAATYTEKLSSTYPCPAIKDGDRSAWAQYTIKCDNRDELAKKLKEQNIPTAVYYPIPLHKQTGYSHYPAVSGLSVSEKLCNTVMSLPMSPFLTREDQDHIITKLIEGI